MVASTAPVAGLLASDTRGSTQLAAAARGERAAEGELDLELGEGTLAVGPNRSEMRSDRQKVEWGDTTLLRVRLEGEGGDVSRHHRVTISDGDPAEGGVGIASVVVQGVRDEGGGEAIIPYKPVELGEQKLFAVVHHEDEGRTVSDEEHAVVLDVVDDGRSTAVDSDDDGPPWLWIGLGAGLLALAAGAIAARRRA